MREKFALVLISVYSCYILSHVQNELCATKSTVRYYQDYSTIEEVRNAGLTIMVPESYKAHIQLLVVVALTAQFGPTPVQSRSYSYSNFHESPFDEYEDISSTGAHDDSITLGSESDEVHHNAIVTHSQKSNRYSVPIYQKIGVPVPHPVPVAVPQYVKINVPQPYPVQVNVEQQIKVPVYKIVPKIIERPVPYTVEKSYPVEVEKPFPVEVLKKIECRCRSRTRFRCPSIGT
ncbi:conserved hypothetical protein [Culex quinquefasciatus]|uniref:Cuticle protein n=1 Tax=Culex quinquefasciatus TaxID=7176 RepID=B0XEH9_CULQU|nr:conserved hypothetical protein [Culex quinquefasciatus]|eukprot:XP_001868051.1 conserved hypothetical protein [Culex quinquefasciatus]